MKQCNPCKVRLRNLALVMLSVVFLSACTHRPPEVYPSLPLLDNSLYSQSKTDNQCLSGLPKTLLLAEKHDVICDDIPTSIYVEKIYFSALGSKCAEVQMRLPLNVEQQRVICHPISIDDESTYWYLVPSVMSDINVQTVL